MQACLLVGMGPSVTLSRNSPVPFPYWHALSAPPATKRFQPTAQTNTDKEGAAYQPLTPVNPKMLRIATIAETVAHRRRDDEIGLSYS
jgi:hypothetical protein